MHGGRFIGLESMFRANRTLKLIKEKFIQGVESASIFIGAGIDPNFKDIDSLGEMIKEYLLNQIIEDKLSDKVSIVMCKSSEGKNVWGSIPESLVIADELKCRSITKVYLVTSWHHMPRVKLIWWLIGGLKTRAVCAKMRMKQWWKKLIVETILLLMTWPDFNRRKAGKPPFKNPFY